MDLSSRRRLTSPLACAGGSTLVTALLTVTVLSFIAANVLLSISSRYNSAYRSASWHEALATAEAGIDSVTASIARVVPNVIPGVNSLGAGYSQPPSNLLGSLRIDTTGLVTNGTILSIVVPPLTHGGEGSTVQQATVSVDVVPLGTLLSGGVPAVLGSVNTLLGGGDMQLLRLRSTGTVYLTGGYAAGPSRQDNELWRVSLLNDSTTHAAVSQPQVSRQIEVYLRPVYAFDSAVASNDSLLAANPGAIFDSFNSLLPTASTNGKYDSLKRGSNATLRANGTAVTLGGKVYGNVNTNGGSVTQAGQVTGTVNNASYCPLPVVVAPTWSGSPLVPSSIIGPTTLAAGIVALPAQYRFTGISGSLHITRGTLGLGTNVEIFVDGDVTGGIEVDPGVTAKLYVSGSLVTNASQLRNDTGLAANLQVYGVPSSAGGSPRISVNLDTALCAAIYAPLHAITFTGSGDVSGAAVGATILATGALRLHYDECLAYSAGPLVRYQIASWKEITAN